MSAGEQPTPQALLAVFADPVSRSIAWADLEALLVAVGCEVAERSGSRVRFSRNGVRAGFHRPHPGKEAKPYQVREAREYLLKLGVRP